MFWHAAFLSTPLNALLLAVIYDTAIILNPQQNKVPLLGGQEVGAGRRTWHLEGNCCVASTWDYENPFKGLPLGKSIQIPIPTELRIFLLPL